MSIHALQVLHDDLTPTLTALLCEEIIDLHGELSDASRKDVIETVRAVAAGRADAWLCFDGVQPLGYQLSAGGTLRRWFREGCESEAAKAVLPVQACS